MKSRFLAALVAGGIVMSGAAFAAAMTATGTVKTYDAAKHMLTLADGTSYMLPKTFKDPGLKVGEKVSVAWTMKGDTHEASAVKIVK